MPRNSQGLYILPAGNPVTPGTLIESQWANTTMDDIGAALTGSLPRDGSAPMTGQLILTTGNPTNQRSATSKEYVDSFMAFATGFPVGFYAYAASGNIPAGWLVCDGSAVSRTTYSDLFAAIGTTYGSGDNSTTFNLPPQDLFLRGVSGSARTVGSIQEGSFAAHTHPVSDPGHTHGATGSQAAHTHNSVHNHGVSDPGHSHKYGALNNSGGAGVWGTIGVGAQYDTSHNGTGISIQNATATSDSKQPAVTVTVASATTNETIGSTGGTETVPRNIGAVLCIKAVNDSAGAATISGITSSDSNMIAISNTNPVSPELVIKSNVAFGIPKLDASGKILLAQLPQGASVLLGYFDASGGANPSQANPGTDYSNGESYIISVGGTILVRNPATSVESNVLVAVGGTLLYLEGQTQPDGWYYSVPVAASSAANISFLPEGTISAVNVQAAIAELDNETQAALATKQDNLPSQTGQAGQYLTTNGTTLDWAEVDALPDQTGHNGEFLTTDGSAASWIPVQANSTSFGLFEHAHTISADYTIGTGNNAISGGPVTVADGISVTVPSGSVWSIV